MCLQVIRIRLAGVNSHTITLLNVAAAQTQRQTDAAQRSEPTERYFPYWFQIPLNLLLAHFSCSISYSKSHNTDEADDDVFSFVTHDRQSMVLCLWVAFCSLFEFYSNSVYVESDGQLQRIGHKCTIRYFFVSLMVFWSFWADFITRMCLLRWFIGLAQNIFAILITFNSPSYGVGHCWVPWVYKPYLAHEEDDTKEVEKGGRQTRNNIIKWFNARRMTLMKIGDEKQK